MPPLAVNRYVRSLSPAGGAFRAGAELRSPRVTSKRRARDRPAFRVYGDFPQGLAPISWRAAVFSVLKQVFRSPRGTLTVPLETPRFDSDFNHRGIELVAIAEAFDMTNPLRPGDGSDGECSPSWNGR
jgi:hypothetical protein